MKSPVKLMRRARSIPITCGSRMVRPAPGMAPTRAWVSAKRARSDAIRKSHESASSSPPVTVGPLTAPIMGVRRGGMIPKCSSCSFIRSRRSDAILGGQRLEVHAGAERGIRPGQDHAADVVAPVELDDRRVELPVELGRDGVPRLGPVQRDRRHTLGDLDQHQHLRPSRRQVPVESDRVSPASHGGLAPLHPGSTRGAAERSSRRHAAHRRSAPSRAAGPHAGIPPPLPSGPTRRSKAPRRGGGAGWRVRRRRRTLRRAAPRPRGRGPSPRPGSSSRLRRARSLSRRATARWTRRLSSARWREARTNE